MKSGDEILVAIQMTVPLLNKLLVDIDEIFRIALLWYKQLIEFFRVWMTLQISNLGNVGVYWAAFSEICAVWVHFCIFVLGHFNPMRYVFWFSPDN